MSLVSYTLHDNIATIAMDDGKANAISPAMVTELNAALDRAERDGAVVVLWGREGMFSGGFDLSVISGEVEAATALVQSGCQLVRRLLTFPTPVIGAVTGHAIAAGAFFLLSCDYRIGIDGEFKYGLNEVAIGLTMPYMGIELARELLPRRYFNRAVMNAELFTSHAAVDAGFLDQVVEAEAFGNAVKALTASMAALDMEAHKTTKLRARKALLEKIDWAIEQDTMEFGVLIGQS